MVKIPEIIEKITELIRQFSAISKIAVIGIVGLLFAFWWLSPGANSVTAWIIIGSIVLIALVAILAELLNLKGRSVKTRKRTKK